MLKSTKTALFAALLGSFALTGVGVAQAQDEPAAPKCVINEHVHVCFQYLEHVDVTGDREVTKVVKSTTSCSAKVRSTEKLDTETVKKHDGDVRQKSKVECSSSISR